MSSADEPASRVVVLDPAEQLGALSKEFQANGGALLISTNASGIPLTPNVRLLVLGPSVPLPSLPKLVSRLRDEAPGVFVAWTCSTDQIGLLSDALRTADAAFVLPGDLGLLEDLVRSRLEGDIRGAASSPAANLAQFIVGILSLILVWEAVVRLFRIPAYLAPPATAVFREMLRVPADYAYHLGVTGAEAAMGFTVGNVIGLFSAVLLYRLAWMRRVVLPAFIGLQSVPIVALAPLLIVWFGAGWTSKVAMASLICYFPMTANTSAAFAAVDSDLQDISSLYRASFLRRLRHLLLPASAASLVAAMRISAGLAVVGAIVAELTGADRGLGYVLLNASYRFETERLFVAIILAATLGVSFYAAPGVVRLFPSFRRFVD